jgi:AcrR family transcriptional regulator
MGTGQEAAGLPQPPGGRVQPDSAPGGPRAGKRTSRMQEVLLHAAREVFAAQGFTGASIADIVERAGISTGSLYYHFGGKSELYIALWQEHTLTHERVSRLAVARARQAGEADPRKLFCIGARAYLEFTWSNRDLEMLFISGDVPPGFDDLRRQRRLDWLGKNDTLLAGPGTAYDRLYVSAVTALMGEGVREVVLARTREHAARMIDVVISYTQAIMAIGAWEPAGQQDG